MLNALAMTAVIATAPTSAELTVYNGGFALVKENRIMRFDEIVAEAA